MGGAGGAGVASSISGSSVTYAGGGGGGGVTPGAGGAGGGGAGTKSGTAGSGTANTGGGGGGEGDNAGTSGNGGSGVVIVSYAGVQRFTGGTVTTSGGNTIHTFTSSSTLAGYLAGDYSPNGNNWTQNNISTTAGVTFDSMTDVPTLTSATAANYAVLNVLSQHASNVTTLSGGNLNVSGNGCLATISMPSGKWYWEATCTSADADQAVGILDIVESNTGAVSGVINPNRGVIYQANTNVRKNGTIVANYATFTNGDVLGLTFDASNNQIAFYKNNTLQGTITADAPTVSYVPHAQTLGGAFSYNFGQRPFSYTPPTGFVALNTFNL